jgi:hypothetical protein
MIRGILPLFCLSAPFPRAFSPALFFTLTGAIFERFGSFLFVFLRALKNYLQPCLLVVNLLLLGSLS